MPNPVTSWRSLLLVFGVTAMVEGIGVSQVFALLPSLLSTMGVPDGERLSFIGLFSSLLFVLGMPLVPLWGVWADKYSRRAVIARSAAVEVVVFGGLALAREPWQVALCMLLIGFQLGNTGVMLAGIRDVTPRQRLGLVIALFGASGAVGFALGPVLAGILIDGAGWSISMVFGLSAAMSLGTALLVMLGTREVRPEVVPRGRVVSLAFGAVRGVLADPAVRRIFVTYFAAFIANQMSRPYVPVLVETIVGRGPGLASAIGLVSGTAALAGALLSPLGGALGDRIGFRRVLLAALGVAAVAIALLPAAAAIGGLATL
ncbi:MAG TPA: MFS transporter, partial [Candidatus Limnocylindrales bacterium]